jgi:hypothetical protein
MSRRRDSTYLKLLKDLEKLKGAVQVLETRIFELIDEFDREKAKQIVAEHEKWMEED